MGKQRSYLLVGLPHTGLPLLTAALERHREALSDRGVRVPAKSVDEAFRAAVEVRREHKAWGLRRRDVEGAWVGICRRALKHHATTVVGHELLAGAAPEEVALVADGLAGTQLHVVVLAGVPDGRIGLFPDELDLAGVLARWRHAVTAPDRLHVVVTDLADPGLGWRALGALVGFDAEALLLPDPATDPGPADTAAMRLVAASAGLHVDHDELVEIAEGWGKLVADRGYDVIGDLRDLVPAPSTGPTDPAGATLEARVDLLTETLTEAVAEIGRLRARLADAEKNRRGLFSRS